MNIYQKYLVCYDIENDKTRKKFFDKMKDLGLISIQKSVFYGDLNQAEFSAMKKVVQKCLILNLTSAFGPNVHCLIKSFVVALVIKILNI